MARRPIASMQSCQHTGTRRLATLPLALLALLACTDVTGGPTGPRVGGQAPHASATHVSDVFFATAACRADLGYDIRFGGSRELVRHVAGTDTTLSFRTQAFDGWRLPETVFTAATRDYVVLGGAEMFNIKRADDGTLEVRIHEGTLVFQSLTTGEKIVARHVIRTQPGQGTMVNGWSCREVG